MITPATPIGPHLSCLTVQFVWMARNKDLRDEEWNEEQR